MLIALINLPAHLGYLILCALIGVESAGLPVPGETALIAAGVLAHHGRFQIELVKMSSATTPRPQETASRRSPPRPIGGNTTRYGHRSGATALIHDPASCEHAAAALLI